MSFELPVRLQGRLLTLRPLRAADFPALLEAASDPLIWEQHPVPERWQEPVFRQYFADTLASGGAMVALDNRDQALIGSSRFNAYDEHAREIEIGWTFLVRRCWGGAWNREMKHLMLRYAARCVDTVLFVVGSRNLRSQRAVTKLGAIRAGSRHHADGRQEYVYRLDLAAYLAAAPALEDPT